MGTKIIWSQILPRFKWRYSTDLIAMKKCRYRVNNSLATYILKHGGYYIRYPDIIRERKLFKDDGVHLAPVANNIFLNTLQGGIGHFINDLGKVYPPQSNDIVGS